jgi:para-nitrobenzyl esterase
LGIPQFFRDGTVLPADGILSAFSRGAFNKVPIIIGSNKNEMRIMLALMAIPPFVTHVNGSLAVKVADKNQYYLAADYSSDLWKANDVDSVATILSRQNPRSVFVYRFDWGELAPAPFLDNISLAASHGVDVPFVFGTLHLGPEYVQIPLIQGPALSSYSALSDKVMSYWSQFAIAGDPGKGRHGNLPQWSPWAAPDANTYTSIVLDSPAHGGVHTNSAVVTKASVLSEIANDPNLGTPMDRCKFLHDLLNVHISRLTLADYNEFDHGSCVKH